MTQDLANQPLVTNIIYQTTHLLYVEKKNAFKLLLLHSLTSRLVQLKVIGFLSYFYPKVLLQKMPLDLFRPFKMGPSMMSLEFMKTCAV